MIILTKFLFIYLKPIFCFSASFFLTMSKFLSFQLLFLNLIGLLPTYLPEKFLNKFKKTANQKN